MYSPQQLIELYEQKFAVNNFHTAPSGLYQPVNHIMSIKGKRIRPLLLLMACDMFGGDVKRALSPAFAVEVFHNFTLVHDDIMDSADIRRGEPTVHKKYGVNSAILAGDVMLSYAYKFLTDVQSGFLAELMGVFNKTAIEIFEGQQMDVDFEKRLDVTEDEYLKMIEYKTSVLLGCCMQLGAILANARMEYQTLAYEFGLKLGLSFQIKDDLLDAFGEAEKVGKKIGGDILQNKKTLLFVAALKNADKTQREKLLALLDEKDADKKVSEVKDLFEATGARKQAMDKSNQLYQQAVEALNKIEIAADRKKALLALAEKINNREF